MSKIDDKLLLLLGVLQGQEAHGYGLMEMLESPAVPIRVGRANAYKLLKKLENMGWAQSKYEQEGQGPGRQTYSVTASGKAAFKQFLRDRLAQHVATEVPDAVTLDFVSVIPPRASQELLERRLPALRERCRELGRFTTEERQAHPGLDLRIHLMNQERLWLERFLKRNKTASEVSSGRSSKKKRRK